MTCSPHERARPSRTSSRCLRSRAELIEGTIVHLPPPLPEHGLPEVEVELAGTVVRPDASGRVYKANLYASAGIGFYWIMSPAERVVEAFELRDGGWFRLGAWTAGETARIRPFEAVELEIARLFPPA